MAATGYFRLEHSSVNRATKGDGYLAASANYASNDNKCEKILHINMAANRHAIRDYIEKHEASLTRKNARLGDKILLSLDSRMSEEHRDEAVRRFLWVITGNGRSQACSFYHTDKPHNPHHHVILLDADENGKSVMLMGANRKNRLKAGLEPNVTVWLRKTWERECNGVLAENGYDFRLDCRRNLEQGLPEPGEHRGWDNDNTIDAPLSTDSQLDAEAESEESEEDFDGDDEMAKLTPAERVQAARELWENYRYIQHGIAERDETIRQYEFFRERAEGAAVSAAAETGVVMQKEQKVYNASLAMKATHREDGRAKGIGLRLFGRTLWESPARRAANEAETRFRTAQLAYENAVKDLEALNDTSARLSSKATELKVKAEALERHVRVLGTDEELAKASEEQLTKINRYVGEMATEELVAMVEEGELSRDECAEMLRVMGRQNDLEVFLGAEELREGRGQSL